MRKLWLKLLVVLFVGVIAKRAENAEWIDVNIAQGPVRGYFDTEVDVFTFYGIPYATAPTGPNKFKPPLPPPSWSEPFEAIEKHIACPQIQTPYAPEHVKVQEDCLTVNVYVPDSGKSKLPVIVYIHGGAFQIGYANQLTPKNLVQSQEVIAVTFNYRLGVHGFLCLGTPDVPGNAAMKDQVAALRWVRDNIASFGGDPNDVTIAGYSAGATSVELLLLSNAAKDLFTKAILDSASSLMAGGVVLDPLQNAISYAQIDGILETDDVYKLEDYYKSLPLDKLFRGDVMSNTDSTSVFAPCVERIIDGNEFLTDAPINIIKSGQYPKIPMLFGFANMEGLFRLPEFGTWKDKMNEKFSDFLPGDLYFENEEEKESVAEQVKEFYFGDDAVSESSILKYIDYFSDVTFIYPILRSTKLYVEHGHEEIYLYEFTFTEEATPIIPFTENVRGAEHCAQTVIVLDGNGLSDSSEINISKEQKDMKSFLRKMWANFAKTGATVPVGSELPKWPPMAAIWAPYMELSLPSMLRSEEIRGARPRFWDELYARYYRAPIPPPPSALKNYNASKEPWPIVILIVQAIFCSM